MHRLVGRNARKWGLMMGLSLPGLLCGQAVKVEHWSGGKSGAVTLSFDDSLPGHWSHASPILQEAGLRGTFFVITDTVDWDGARAAASLGHEIASHSTADATLKDDAAAADKMAASHEAIESEIGTVLPGYQCHTIAWPYGARRLDVINDPANPEWFIAARGAGNTLLAANSVNAADTTLWWKYGQGDKGMDHFYVIGDALMTTGTSLTTYENQLDLVESTGGWTVFTYHGIETGGYQNISAAAFTQQAAAVAARDNLWVAPFGDVVRYIRQRDAATVTVIENTGQRIELTVTDDLDDSLYHLPLSFSMDLPAGWSGVTANQNGTAIDARLSDGRLHFNAVPDQGPVVLENAASPLVTPEVSASQTATGLIALQWQSQSGVLYTIESSQNLTTWDPLETLTDMEGDGQRWTRELDWNGQKTFFRIVLTHP